MSKTFLLSFFLSLLIKATEKSNAVILLQERMAKEKAQRERIKDLRNEKNLKSYPSGFNYIPSAEQNPGYHIEYTPELIAAIHEFNKLSLGTKKNLADSVKELKKAKKIIGYKDDDFDYDEWKKELLKSKREYDKKHSQPHINTDHQRLEDSIAKMKEANEKLPSQVDALLRLNDPKTSSLEQQTKIFNFLVEFQEEEDFKEEATVANLDKKFYLNHAELQRFQGKNDAANLFQEQADSESDTIKNPKIFFLLQREFNLPKEVSEISQMKAVTLKLASFSEVSKKNKKSVKEALEFFELQSEAILKVDTKKMRSFLKKAKEHYPEERDFFETLANFLHARHIIQEALNKFNKTGKKVDLKKNSVGELLEQLKNAASHQLETQCQ